MAGTLDRGVCCVFTKLFPHLASFRLDYISVEGDRVTFRVRPTRRSARCPLCRRVSRRVHSRYQRTLADLPLSSRPVVLHVQVRRFRCSNRQCARAIFAERLPQVGSVRARRTPGQRRALEEIGFALGGAPGARLADSLGLPVSRATVLRLVCAAPSPTLEIPRVLGLDDWAWRRGRRYGSILVDLEQRRPVDLLPDRTAESVAQWLRDHPGVEIISRDRAGAYADGARHGAPGARQVADRFHLLANVGETLERVLGGQRTALRQAAAAVDRSAVGAAQPAVTAAVAEPPRLTRIQQDQQARRAHRLARYEAVLVLHQQGFSQVAISQQLGLERKTIRRYLRADAFPERAPPSPRPSILGPYQAYLRSRWTEGCHNAHTLWQEIQGQGFAGGEAIVRRYLAVWRTRPAARGRAAQRLSGTDTGGPAPAAQPTRVLSPRQARWLLLRAWDDLQPGEQRYRTHLLEGCPALREAQGLAEHFGRLVRERDLPAFHDWLKRAETSALPEFRSFVVGLRRDQAAVEAALTSEWSNGQTEGQINRLKCLKRQMFGRAKFPLLRQRVLRAG
jgi:transposase